MKTRMGFVSNSSTTSFCVYGVGVQYGQELYDSLFGKQEKKITKKVNCNHVFNRDICKFCPECGKKSWNIIEEKNGFDIETFASYFSKHGLDFVSGAEDDFFVGRNLGEDGISGIELEKLIEVREKLKRLFPDLKADFFSGSYES